MPGMKVLLVDDNAMFRALATRVLEDVGFEVRSLDPASVFEVLKLAREFAPDVAIIDYHLPRCNAETLAVILKRDETFGRVRILAISTSRDSAVVEAMAACGADAFVFKGAMAGLVESVRGMARMAPDPAG